MDDTANDGILLNPAGQEVTPLVREVMERCGIEQGEVKFLQKGTWLHASERSAVVAVETSQRTRAALEFDQPGDSPCRVEDLELHYIHIFFLDDLEPDTEYQFHIAAEDRRGVKSDSGTLSLKTRSMSEAIRIPGQLSGPQYILDQAGAHYLLTEDITTPGTGLQIAANDVTLDLGGHRVTYDEEHQGLDDGEATRPAFGILIPEGCADVRIFNGSILQGAGQDQGTEGTIGFNPIFLSDAGSVEIAGVHCIYAGTQLSGIFCQESGPDVRIHHNVVEDQGRLIVNRHQMCSAIRLGSEQGGALINNLVKRARQSALGNAGARVEIAHNELNIDSHSINSFGIGVKDDSTVHHNRIFGCGDNVVGMATTGGCKNVQLYENYIWLQAHDISAYQPYLNDKEMESSDYSIMSGVRITWGANDIDYHHNVVLTTAREGGYVRGTFLYNDNNVHGCRFRDSLVVAIAEDEQSHGWGAIAGVGNETRGPTEPLLFSGNTIVSNFANFNMQDSYGVAVNYHFIGNTFVKVGDRADYATIRAREVRPSKEHIFLNNGFGGGAGYDQLAIGPEDEFTAQWSCEPRGSVGALVVIEDADGQQVFAGEIPDAGWLSVPLTWFRQEGDRRIEAGPYTVTITDGGETARRTVRPTGQ